MQLSVNPNFCLYLLYTHGLVDTNAPQAKANGGLKDDSQLGSNLLITFSIKRLEN